MPDILPRKILTILPLIHGWNAVIGNSRLSHSKGHAFAALRTAFNMRILQNDLDSLLIKPRPVMEALDLAMEVLFPFTDFHKASFEMFLKYTDSNLTFDEEQMLKATIRQKALAHGARQYKSGYFFVQSGCCSAYQMKITSGGNGRRCLRRCCQSKGCGCARRRLRFRSSSRGSRSEGFR
jgi:hypothetical protein